MRRDAGGIRHRSAAAVVRASTSYRSKLAARVTRGHDARGLHRRLEHGARLVGAGCLAGDPYLDLAANDVTAGYFEFGRVPRGLAGQYVRQRVFRCAYLDPVPI